MNKEHNGELWQWFVNAEITINKETFAISKDFGPFKGPKELSLWTNRFIATLQKVAEESNILVEIVESSSHLLGDKHPLMEEPTDDAARKFLIEARRLYLEWANRDKGMLR